MSDWIQVSLDQLSKEEPVRSDRGHSFRGLHGEYGWPRFCSHCGHVPLKNGISMLVTRIGCDYERDARFVTWVRGGKKAFG